MVALFISLTIYDRPPRLQWHRLWWHSSYSDCFLVQIRISLYWKSLDRVTLAYSDIFLPFQHCHCKRGGLECKYLALIIRLSHHPIITVPICLAKDILRLHIREAGDLKEAEGRGWIKALRGAPLYNNVARSSVAWEHPSFHIHRLMIQGSQMHCSTVSLITSQ